MTEPSPPQDQPTPLDALPQAPEGFRSGFAALVGRPNAGKSTLVNACIKSHIAITSPVAQTTRRRLRAVVERPGAQIVLVDTPGLHKPKDALGRELNRQALAELDDVDVVAMLVDATKPVGRGDAWVASHVARARAPKLLVITKADLADAERVGRQIEAARELAPFDDAVVTSAKEGFNVDAFLDLVASRLPAGPRWFPEDMPWDATDEELVAEFVREKVLLACREEVPHAVGVLCRGIRWARDGHASIAVDIYVERESQKAILIGRGGSMVRRIGAQARRDIERLLGARVYLDLEVRVQRGWRSDERQLRALGYAAED